MGLHLLACLADGGHLDGMIPGMVRRVWPAEGSRSWGPWAGLRRSVWRVPRTQYGALLMPTARPSPVLRRRGDIHETPPPSLYHDTVSHALTGNDAHADGATEGSIRGHNGGDQGVWIPGSGVPMAWIPGSGGLEEYMIHEI